MSYEGSKMPYMIIAHFRRKKVEKTGDVSQIRNIDEFIV